MTANNASRMRVRFFSRAGTVDDAGPTRTAFGTVAARAAADDDDRGAAATRTVLVAVIAGSVMGAPGLDGRPR
jgi:hypothetical protein